MPETIVMIHGMWGGGWYWEKYKTFFEENGYQCITPTLRFHDMDPKELPNPQLGITSLLDYAEYLEREIREIDDVPILMGHSMGGLLAQILGSRGLAKALVLLTPGAPSGIMALKPSVMKSFWSALTKWGFWRKPMRQTFEEAVYSMLHLLPPEEQREIYSRFVYESGRAGFEMGFWLLDLKKAAKVDESKVTCPVLVIAGAQDRITPASVVQKVADKYKDVSTYKEFSDHAHWVIGEPGWQEIAEYISDWLNQVLSESR
ncbi:MAG: alpha/beta hydrolase [Candidatus Heimdallarchaeota archaeon]